MNWVEYKENLEKIIAITFFFGFIFIISFIISSIFFILLTFPFFVLSLIVLIFFILDYKTQKEIHRLKNKIQQIDRVIELKQKGLC